jgi:copper chaperone CopZ
MTKDTDIVTGVTQRLSGKRGDGSGHQKIKVTGIFTAETVEQLSKRLFDIPGVIAVKISPEKSEFQYNQNPTADLEQVKLALEAVGLTFVRKV